MVQTIRCIHSEKGIFSSYSFDGVQIINDLDLIRIYLSGSIFGQKIIFNQWLFPEEQKEDNIDQNKCCICKQIFKKNKRKKKQEDDQWYCDKCTGNFHMDCYMRCCEDMFSVSPIFCIDCQMKALEQFGIDL